MRDINNIKNIKKIMVCLVLSVVAIPFIILSLTGCSGEDEPLTEYASADINADTEAGAITVTEDDSEDGSEGDTGDITLGYFDGDTYINDSFDFELKLDGDDRWSFKDMDEATDENADASPYEQSLTYLAVAGNEETGSSIIVNYMCPAANGLAADMTAGEYLAKAAESYDGAETGKEKLAGEDWDYLERTDLTDAEQKIYAKAADGIIVMITFTVTDDEDCETMIK
jgi:hypothetical protein